MRLLSLQLRNYRLHRDVKITFDSQRTLIGGRNETGKSTLVEAAHCALFLSHRRGGQDQKSMVSNHHPGTPEVELEFECGDTRYHLKKCFGGASKGSAKLRSDRHEEWTNNDAEDKLAELLGLDGPVSPKHVSSQWAHLWIRQGHSGSDPSGEASTQKDALLARLQEQGGAVVMQSDRDSQVATAFAEQNSKQFTNSDKPRAGSDLGQAESRLTSAADALEAAKDTADRLEEAVKLSRQSQQTLREADASIHKLEQDQRENDKKLGEVEALQHEEKERKREHAEAKAKHGQLNEADKKIRSLENTIQKLSENLDPKQTQLEKMRGEHRNAEKHASEAVKQLNAASDTLRQIRLNHELAQRHVDQFRCQQRLANLDKARKQVTTTRSLLTPLKARLAALPQLDSKGLEKLRTLDARRSNARAALDAMATGIEWTQGKGPVRIDGRKLASKQVEILSEESELIIGEIHIVIRPGGGANLDEARGTLAIAESELQASLTTLGLADLDAARANVEMHQAINSEISTLSNTLETLNPKSLDEDWEAHHTEQIGLTATIKRLAAQIPSHPAAETADDAGKALAAMTSTLKEAVSQEDQAKGQQQAAQEAREDFRKRISQAEEKLRKEEGRLHDHRASYKAQVELHGEIESRLTKLSQTGQTRDQANQQLKKIRQQLETLQADQLSALRVSLTRSLKAKQQLKSEADRNLASAKSTLTSDGTSDPYNDLATAEAILTRETESYNAIKRHAFAIKRLADLFRSEQQELADQFTAPLAEKITGYLKILFGPDAAAKVSLNADGFEGLELARRQGNFKFDSLSGGTREQLAAAVRLAIAELLAADHDGCLPLVFDDAFTNSDPERIRLLQRMLDRAANRGLQIIILSCTPSDYDTLGASEIVLQPPNSHTNAVIATPN